MKMFTFLASESPPADLRRKLWPLSQSPLVLSQWDLAQSLEVKAGMAVSPCKQGRLGGLDQAVRPSLTRTRIMAFRGPSLTILCGSWSVLSKCHWDVAQAAGSQLTRLISQLQCVVSGGRPSPQPGQRAPGSLADFIRPVFMLMDKGRDFRSGKMTALWT